MRRHAKQNVLQQRTLTTTVGKSSTTALNALLEVPDYFFSITFPFLGIVLSLSRNFQRLSLEERAWEQRLEEAREKKLREDPTATEIDLRRKEASLEWSAYGKPRMEEAERRRDDGRSTRRRVQVLDREEDIDQEEEEQEYSSPKEHSMTDKEIASFELEYGIEYDPYYDDPYSVDDLPDDVPFNVDRRYGDRIYDNGEIFYKDKESGLFYRQGSKPRNLSLFDY